MPSKENREHGSYNEKRQRQTNSGVTIHNLNLVPL
jgi:hypothetical protein